MKIASYIFSPTGKFMTAILFLTVNLLTLVLFYRATGRHLKILWISIALLLLSGIPAYTGFFHKAATEPQRLLFILLPAITFCIYCYKNIRIRVADLNYAFAIHALRLPVEIVLYRLFLEGKVPELMTFAGWNFDIFMGITAILIFVYTLATKRQLHPKLLLAWNITGILLLSIIVSLAVLSAPLPIQQFAFEQPNVALLSFPYTFLPAYVVPVVLSTHLIVLKALYSEIRSVK
jgi:hypothetical protein